MSQELPRILLVTRRTPLEMLLERFGTRGQAEFYLRSRGQEIGWSQAVHDKLYAALTLVQQAIPPHQRRVRIDRDELDRFLFAPNDVICVVGQDGLVPNVAKYLRGQTVIGINPDPAHYDGVLCAHAAEVAHVLIKFACDTKNRGGQYRIEERSMALARREDGQELRSLNEIFVGHVSHQSARYRLSIDQQTERHSSSGVIVATGTGATGWTRSICEQRAITTPLPHAVDRQLVWMVREPFPSVATGTAMNFGLLDASQKLVVQSEMDDGGVLFADGIESDRIEFLSGQRCEIGLAPERLRLVVKAAKK